MKNVGVINRMDSGKDRRLLDRKRRVGILVFSEDLHSGASNNYWDLLILTNTVWDKHYYESHFTDKETESLGRLPPKAVLPKSHSWERGSCDSGNVALNCDGCLCRHRSFTIERLWKENLLKILFFYKIGRLPWAVLPAQPSLPMKCLILWICTKAAVRAKHFLFLTSPMVYEVKQLP